MLGLVELTAFEVEVWKKGLNYSLLAKIPLDKAKQLVAKGLARAIDFQTIVLLVEGGERLLQLFE